jgi:hypothetical protein
MKIDWVKKLTSRKFWLALASFVSMLIIAFGASEQTGAQVSAIIMAGASVLGYILAEGLVDASNTQNIVIEDDNTIYDDFDEDDEDEEEPGDTLDQIKALLADETKE